MTTDHSDDAPLEGRIIPPGAPLPPRETPGSPYRQGPTDIPAGPPAVGARPPWWEDKPLSAPASPPPPSGGGAPARPEAPTPAPPPPPRFYPAAPVAVADPPPVQIVRHEHHIVLAPPRPWWRRAITACRPWTTILGFALAVIPVPLYGYSASALWQSVVYYSRIEGGAWVGYGLATGALVGAGLLVARAGDSFPRQLISRCAIATALVGATGAFRLWDPIEFLTGVPL
ncbi:hypothetical protein [Streptomyces bohaiensis]|uniref:hypothetical protein n=1 Tax=Streptomyces bohaiensis TaxID=1431344 RepID=UPI003B7B90BA